MSTVRSAGAKSAGGAPGNRRSGSAPSKQIVDAIREATGASDEDISVVLAECNYDVNEATTRLINSMSPGPGFSRGDVHVLSWPAAKLFCLPFGLQIRFPRSSTKKTSAKRCAGGGVRLSLPGRRVSRLFHLSCVSAAWQPTFHCGVSCRKSWRSARKSAAAARTAGSLALRRDVEVVVARARPGASLAAWWQVRCAGLGWIRRNGRSNCGGLITQVHGSLLQCIASAAPCWPVLVCRLRPQAHWAVLLRHAGSTRLW